MKCDYCKTNEIQGLRGTYEEIIGHVICDECFEYLNTFCELEEALAAAKARIQQLELEIASHESDGVAA